MAILSKIRERSLFLIIVIALALFSFVIGDVFTRGGMGGNKNSVGEINGENISIEEFAELVEQQRTRTGNRGSQLQSVNAAWDNLVREKVYKTQLEKSGIIVGEKDVWDEIVNQPFVQDNPQFKNEIGVFDEEKFKEYISTLKDAATEDQQGESTWLSWLNYESNIKSNLQIKTYNNLISAGLGATLKDGEHYYFDNNTKLDLEYIYIPHTFIADSLVTVTDDEIKKYVKSNADDYRVEASRDISYVKFNIVATPQDELAIKTQLKELIDDREEYSSAAKANVKITGFANTDNVVTFFRDNSSDTPLDSKFYTKSKLNQLVADSIFKLNIGEVYGPYKEGELYKISKLVEVKQIPDSVKSRHILIPFLGARSANPTITQNEEEAKKTADSLLVVLKNDNSKFADVAKNLSSDTGSGAKGGDLGWYPYERMVPEFRDFSFENKVGDMNVVKTDFGFHIIEIEGQKNIQPAVNVATFSRKIVASEDTENDIFQKAETFASEISKGIDMMEYAKGDSLIVQPVLGLKAMDEIVSTLGDQRQIVTWTFEKSTNEDDIKRFDIEKGYAVVKLTKKRKKGLSLGNFKFSIRTILLNEKKVNLIKQKIKGDDLEEIAKTFNQTVNSSKAVSLGSPVLPGVGRSTELITILTSLEENKTYSGIEAQNGVFVVKINKKDSPSTLENYKSFTNTVSNAIKVKSAKSFATIKKLADIEDNRALIY